MPAPLGPVPPGGAGGGGLPGPGGRRRPGIFSSTVAIVVPAPLGAGGFALWPALAPEGRRTSARGALPKHGWEGCSTPGGTCTDLVLAGLCRARHRYGVEVRVILDRSHLRVLVDDPAGIAHNKVMVIDDDKVITGSVNFTGSAQERNAATWERRRAVSRPYEPAPIPAATAHAPASPRRALDNLF